MIDLHVHSDFSDGSAGVSEILTQAKHSNVELLSFVDHDTVSTYEHAAAAASKLGIVLLPGIEISAFDFKRQRKVHVLGYYYDLPALHIRKICAPLLKRRHELSMRQLAILEKAGYRMNDVAHSREGIVYKQHLMKSITDADYESKEYQALYLHLFKNGGICAGDIEYIDVQEAVYAIKKDHGLAVIAHPGQLDSYDLILELEGLDGLEAFHPDHQAIDVQKTLELAKKRGLWVSGGSDHHGRYGAPYPLASCTTPLETIVRIILGKR